MIGAGAGRDAGQALQAAIRAPQIDIDARLAVCCCDDIGKPVPVQILRHQIGCKVAGAGSDRVPFIETQVREEIGEQVVPPDRLDPRPRDLDGHPSASTGSCGEAERKVLLGGDFQGLDSSARLTHAQLRSGEESPPRDAQLRATARRPARRGEGIQAQARLANLGERVTDQIGAAASWQVHAVVGIFLKREAP